MEQFAFLSRHQPTAEQIALAADANIELIPIGDCDAFAVSPSFVDAAGPFAGVVVVHPATALRLASTFVIGVFQAAERPAVGEAPPDAPRFKALHLFDLVD